ncbi:MAG TPA: rhamnulokinase family protein [Solirubrobacteraceae bacterium]|nr:rhamnulokinase family protein [Solirubrobacteraceae bacterium]
MTDAAPAFAAADLGAESGRVIVGRLSGERLTLEETHRFANTPVSLPGGIHWNLLSLFEQIVLGLGRAVAAHGSLAGVAVDTWGVDYGLLDHGHRLLGLPYHYRDPRTDGMVELADRRLGSERRYARTGTQTMPINTVFQLLAERDAPALQAAEHIALIPDLLGLWLTGELANESTIASTTGLLDARTGGWARDVVAGLGLPQEIFQGATVEPGAALGTVRAELEGIAGLPVWNVAAHDTASAFVAAPVSSPNCAILSSGTWSLLGVEVDAPVLDGRAAAFNLTNERGIDGSIRLLRNVMGLWLLQECRRDWSRLGIELDYAELEALASRPGDGEPLFDPDDPDLLARGDMPSRIARLCEAGGEQPPREPGQFVRAILISLACKYKLVMRRLECVTGRRFEAIHVIGGGTRNRVLCQLAADLTGLPVTAGPIEATALGNILVQARAAGHLGSLSEMRELVSSSCALERYEPAAEGRAVAIYERFLTVTGFTDPAHEPTLAQL